MRLADIYVEILEVPAVKGCFHQEQTRAKIGAMTATRAELPDAAAATLSLAARARTEMARGSAARFLRSGRSRGRNRPKSKPAIRRAGLRCLSCGRCSLSGAMKFLSVWQRRSTGFNAHRMSYFASDLVKFKVGDAMLGWIFAIVMLFGLSTSAAAYTATKKYQRLEINGWSVYVHPDIAADKSLSKKMIGNLSSQLSLLPKLIKKGEILAYFRKVNIWLVPFEKTGSPPPSPTGFYVDNRRFLSANGLNPNWYKGVFLVEKFADSRNAKDAKLMIHEFSHAYHHGVLKYSNRTTRTQFGQFTKNMRSKKADPDSTVNLQRSRCRESTDHLFFYAEETIQEFFAVFSEIFVGGSSGCQYPFTLGVMKKDSPQMYTLLEKVWGPPRIDEFSAQTERSASSKSRNTGKSRLPRRLAALDANEDGVISRSEAKKRLKAEFDAIDCDRSGGLSGREIRRYMVEGKQCD